jgi:hypothetical protein
MEARESCDTAMNHQHHKSGQTGYCGDMLLPPDFNFFCGDSLIVCAFDIAYSIAQTKLSGYHLTVCVAEVGSWGNCQLLRLNVPSFHKAKFFQCSE